MVGGGPRQNYTSIFNTSRNDGELLWVYNLTDRWDDYTSPTPVIVGHYNTLYFGFNKSLYALDPNGNLLWKTELVTYGIRPIAYSNLMTTPAIDERGNIYVTGPDEKIRAFHNDGTLKWTFSFADYSYRPLIPSSPIIAPDGTILFGTVERELKNDPYLFALYPNGALRWSYQVASGITGAPVITPNNTILFGTTNGGVITLTMDGGFLNAWDYNGRIYRAPTVGSDGAIYVVLVRSEQDQNPRDEIELHAINPDFSERWSLVLKNRTIWSPVVLGPDGTIYLQINPGILTAISPDGAVKWSKGNDDHPCCSVTPVVGQDGTVYTGGHHTLIAINPDGTEKQLEHKAFITSVAEAPAIGRDGTLYFSESSKPRIRAIGNLTTSPAKPLIPEPPGDLVAEVDPGKVVLAWAKPPKNLLDEGSEFILHRKDGSSSNEEEIPVGSFSLGYADTSVENGQTYIYYLTAVNDHGESYPGNLVHAYPFMTQEFKGWPMFQFGPDHSALSPYDTTGNRGKLERTIGSNLAPLRDPVIGADGTIYANNNGKLVALDGKGEEKWRLGVDTSVFTGPVLGPEASRYRVARGKGLPQR